MDENDTEDFLIPRKRLKFNTYYKDEKEIEEEYVYSKHTGIHDLPPEIIRKIFSFMESKTLLHTVRLVCHNFQDLILNILHARFEMLENKIKDLVHVMSMKLKERGPLKVRLQRIDLYYCAQILMSQYKMLKACTWRYMRHGSSGLSLCPYNGAILDNFEEIIYKIRYKSPNLLFIYNRSLEVDLLQTRIKKFIDSFEKYIEKKFNNNCFVSGTKICDILEAALYSKREIRYENYENGMCIMQIIYTFPDAWFNSMKVSPFAPGRSYSWEEDQRLMFNRLRRLVLEHTSFGAERKSYKLKTNLNPHKRDFYKPPFGVFAANNLYDGYRYYYGCIVPGLYRALEDNAIPDQRLEIEPLVLHITVDIKCPLRYAPKFVYDKYCMDIADFYEEKQVLEKLTRQHANKFHMTVTFRSTLALLNVSGSEFCYEISERKRIENAGRDS